MEKEKVLVTGGAGFIGSHIVDRLIIGGYDVAVLDNLSTGSKDNVNPDARFYEADIFDASSVFEIEKPEHVIHNAAQVSISRSIRNPAETTYQNCAGSDRIFELCRDHHVRKVIFPSTSAVYGGAKFFPIKEADYITPRNTYASSKDFTEGQLTKVWGKHMKYFIFRYGNVYGPRQNPKGEAGVIGVFIDSLLNGRKPQIWGSGEQVRDYVYVEDVVDANIRALKIERDSRPYNIATGVGTSVNEIYGLVRKFIEGPELEDIEHTDYRESVSKIILEPRLAGMLLDWKPKTTLEKGIEKTVEWYRAQPR